ncbi:MAG: hypothetical protein AAF657_14745 [Acidobacteriota bacterium]
MYVEFLAAWESRLRPLLTRLPPTLAVRLYSHSRGRFIASLAAQRPRPQAVPEGLERILWGLRFRSPLLNAAGMFKQGEGYRLAARQGAGAYLAGTTTQRRRLGNRKHGIARPFAPYPRSGAASNWLGLPNPGHREVARRLQRSKPVDGCPLGASAATSPDPHLSEEEKLEQLTVALQHYEAAGIDFLEINESCPNTAEDPGGLEAMRTRLAYVAEHYLEHRQRVLPVIVKLSCDTAVNDVAELVAVLAGLGFDGVNFGNTSIAYDRHRQQLDPAEIALYDYFTRSFGGGVSGRPLKADSLCLAKAAVAALQELAPDREFHVIRTGGIEGAADVRASLAAGVALCQWYSGYFEAFSHHGHRLYRRLYDGL